MENMSGGWLSVCIAKFVKCTCYVQHLNNKVVSQCKEKKLDHFLHHFLQCSENLV